MPAPFINSDQPVLGFDVRVGPGAELRASIATLTSPVGRLMVTSIAAALCLCSWRFKSSQASPRLAISCPHESRYSTSSDFHAIVHMSLFSLSSSPVSEESVGMRKVRKRKCRCVSPGDAITGVSSEEGPQKPCSTLLNSRLVRTGARQLGQDCRLGSIQPPQHPPLNYCSLLNLLSSRKITTATLRCRTPISTNCCSN